MIPTDAMSHEDYLRHLRRMTAIHGQNAAFRQGLAAHAKEVVILTALSLDPIRDALIDLYCPTGQGAPRDPTAMIRSWLTMTLTKAGSPTAWVQTLRTDPVLAVLAGFDPLDTPGVGTHYDFLNRLADGPYDLRRAQDTTLSQYLRGRHTRFLDDRTRARQEDAAAFGSQAEKTATELLAHADAPRDPVALQTRLETLFARLGLQGSLDRGLFGESPTLTIAGDGTILASAASPHGERTCTCADRATCPHQRRYTSVTAQWCYDSAHDKYVFGDRYYTLTLHLKGHDLPLLTLLVGGNESDFTLSLKALDDLLKLLRDLHLPLKVGVFVGDGHHDASPIYRYLTEKGILPVIPLTKTEAATTFPHPPATRPDLRFDEDGVPLCPGGKRMRYQGVNRRKARHGWACPANHASRQGGRFHHVFCAEECPCHANCHPETDLGFFVSVKADSDLRLFPPIPRESERFTTLYATRTGTERSNSTDDAYDLDHRCRQATYGLIRLTLVNLCKHAVVWWREALKTQTATALLEAALDLSPPGAPA